MNQQTNKSNLDLNIVSFWKAQKAAWQVTVIRTSMERFGYKLVLPYLTLFVVLMGATKTEVGFVTSLGIAAGGLMGPFLGQHIDRHGPKQSYILGICVILGGYMAFAGAPVWQVAALGMFLYQAGHTLSIQSCANICGNCLANCDRAKGMLVCEALAAGALGMVAPMLSGWILVNIMDVNGTPTNAEQIRPLFYISMIFSFLSLLLIIFKLDVRTWGTGIKSKHSVFKDGIIFIKNDINCLKWIGPAIVNRLPNALVIPYLQLYAAEVRGASAATLAAMTTAAALTSVCFGYLFGILSDKIGRKKTLFATIALYAAGLVLLITTKSNWVLILVGVLTGFQEIGATLSATMRHELVPPQVRGRWTGVDSFAASMVCAAVAFVSGIIYDGLGPQWVFLIYIGCEAVVRLPLLFSLPETLTYKVNTSHFTELDK